IGCTLDNNTAVNGGAVSNQSELLSLVGCTLSGNHATNGGAIFNSASAAVFAQQSTIVGNVADVGGGLYNGSGYVSQFFHSVYPGESDFYDVRVYGSVTMSNSIVAANVSQSDSGHNDLGGAVDYYRISDSLIGDTQNSPDFDVSSWLELTLADNGGPTKTHALVA